MKKDKPSQRERRLRAAPRPRTLSPAALRRLRQRAPVEEAPSHERPATRADCQCVLRPCPYVGCRYHLYLDVKPSGAITVSRPHLEPWEIPESCGLDVAERGGHTLDEIGELLNLSWERVRKLEQQALDRLLAEHGAQLKVLWRGARAAPRADEMEALACEVIGPQDGAKAFGSGGL